MEQIETSVTQFCVARVKRGCNSNSCTTRDPYTIIYTVSLYRQLRPCKTVHPLISDEHNCVEYSSDSHAYRFTVQRGMFVTIPDVCKVYTFHVYRFDRSVSYTFLLLTHWLPRYIRQSRFYFQMKFFLIKYFIHCRFAIFVNSFVSVL